MALLCSALHSAFETEKRRAASQVRRAPCAERITRGRSIQLQHLKTGKLVTILVAICLTIIYTNYNDDGIIVGGIVRDDAPLGVHKHTAKRRSWASAVARERARRKKCTNA